jgi:RNA-directed DNA polymerase
MRRTNLKIGIHVRYCDDILIICKDIEDARKFMYSTTKYLTRNMKLTINNEKTKIYDLTSDKMKFLGYVFYVFKGHKYKKVDRYLVANTLSKTKENEIVDKCLKLLKNIKQNPNYYTIHEWNTYVIGVHNYFKGMTHFNKCFKKIGWRIYKRFYHTMHKKVKFITDQTYKNNFRNSIYKSWGKKGYYCYETYPIINIDWCNWDKSLIHAGKCTIKRENPYDYGKKSHTPGVSLSDINYLVDTSIKIKNSQFAMFRISKYSSVKGIIYLSGKYIPVENYYCHHIIPTYKNGKNDFNNLCVLSEDEHSIIHSSTPEILYTLFPRRKKRIKKLIDNL